MWRGSGRASGRETTGRVAAGAVARKFLESFGVRIEGATVQVATVKAARWVPGEAERNVVRSPDPESVGALVEAIERALALPEDAEVYNRTCLYSIAGKLEEALTLLAEALAAVVQKGNLLGAKPAMVLAGPAFLGQLAPERRAELVKANVITSAEDATSRFQELPLADHLAGMATAMAILPAISSPFSLISGMNTFLIRSCEIAAEMAISRPAAVDRAAARACAWMCWSRSRSACRASRW